MDLDLKKVESILVWNLVGMLFLLSTQEKQKPSVSKKPGKMDGVLPGPGLGLRIVQNATKRRKTNNMAGKSKKGGAYEREICKTLSTWWCGEDDALWRTAGSGGRATTRAKQGKKTSGGEGDVTATDLRARWLMWCFAIELKRGYSRGTPAARADLHGLLDTPSHRKATLIEQWIEQAERSRKQSGAAFWMIIHRRDGQESLVFLPERAFDNVMKAGCLFGGARAKFEFLDAKGEKWIKMIALTLRDFLRESSREKIIDIGQGAKRTHA